MLSISIGSFSHFMSYFEGGLFGNHPPQFPPVFIIGLPRSGTTLIYQTLCHCFQFAFTPMLTNYMVWLPSLSARLCRNGQLRYASDFKSNYGVSKGLASPGEGGMWNLWFSKNRYYREVNTLGGKKAADIIRFVGRTERIFNAPFLNKNLRNNNRIRPLADLFPRALFIVVLRNPRDVALSLLRARVNIYGDVNRFYSIKPSSYAPSPDRSPEKSVVDQMSGLVQDLWEAMVAVGVNRFLVIRYEAFCASPSAGIQRIHDRISDRGVALEKRHPPPDAFKPSKGLADGLRPEQIETVDALIEKEFDGDTYHRLISQR